LRIGIVGPTFPYRGGVAHYTTLLVQHLRQTHQICLYSYRRQYPRFLFPGNTDPDPSRQGLQADCEYLLDPFYPWTWWRTFNRIRQARPDLLILQWWTPFWTPSLYALTYWVRHRTQIPILFLCHHIIAPEGGMLDWFLARFVFRRADGFIVMSEEDYALLRRALPQAYIRGTTHPIYDMFSVEPRDPGEARARLGLGTEERVLLFFGFVRRYKGLRYLLQALPEVRREMPVRLLVVGEFWEDERTYQEMIAGLGLQEAVTVVNRYVPNEEVGLYFAAADVLVLPYLEASQSGVVQMSFGFERPVIATRVGGLAETIEHNRTGLIVAPGDAQALAAAIVSYFQQNMGPRFQEGIRETKDRFAWEHLVRLIEQMHAEIARRRSHG
jgi:glycosyltransferase involved in cell wall biosynthesis